MALRPSKTDAHQRKAVLVFDPETKTDSEVKYAPIKKKRVAAYARVSTELDEQQSSYEAQINYYTDYIRSKPEWEFVEVYSDDGISGTSFKNRDGFNRMVNDAKAGKIDLILTKSISRFARNTVDALSITRQLKAVGVEVYFEKENISSMDTQAELIFTIMSSVAQEESRSLSENVRWGKRRSMEAGKVSLAWSSFLGYNKGPDGLPEIVPEEAEIVRKIYQMYLGGDSFCTIANKLTESGIKTPRKKDIWRSDVVRSILTNEKYMGDARLQKTYVVDFLTKETRKNKGELRQWYIEDSHDAIVSRETFELVQKEIARRSARKGRFYDSPFTNKLICGACGSFYGHHVWHPQESCRKEVWICCDKYKGNHIYDIPSVTDEQIIACFRKALQRILSKSGDIASYCEEYEKNFLHMIGDTKLLEEKLKILSKDHDMLGEELEHMLADNARRAQDQTAFTRKFNSILATFEAKQEEIDTVRNMISDSLARRENARIFLHGLRNADSLFTKFDIKTWHHLVDTVEVMPENALLFHFRNGSTVSVSLEEVH